MRSLKRPYWRFLYSVVALLAEIIFIIILYSIKESYEIWFEFQLMILLFFMTLLNWQRYFLSLMLINFLSDKKGRIMFSSRLGYINIHKVICRLLQNQSIYNNICSINEEYFSIEFLSIRHRQNFIIIREILYSKCISSFVTRIEHSAKEESRWYIFRRRYVVI